MAGRHHRQAVAVRWLPAAQDRAGRARRDPDAGPLHAVSKARRGVGVRAVARREPVHGHDRPGGIRRGGRRARSRNPADADELAHAAGRGGGIGQIDRDAGAAGPAAVGACFLPRGRVRPGAPQPPAGRGRRCESRARPGREPPHGRENRPAAALQYLRPAGRPRCRRRGHGSGGRHEDHRPPPGIRLQDPGPHGALRDAGQPGRHSRCVWRARPARAVQGLRPVVAGRQQRPAGVPRGGRPAGRAAAGTVRALPGSRPGQRAERAGHGGARRRAGERSLDVLPPLAVGARETGRPAEDRPAKLGPGPGAAGACGASGRAHQAAAGARARLRREPYRGRRKRRRDLCRGRDSGGLRPARRAATPAAGARR